LRASVPLDAPPEPEFPPVPRRAGAAHADRRAAAASAQRTYMMFEHDDGVVLIDQHSAHERVLYEKFMGMLERGEAPSQRLLFPADAASLSCRGEAFEAHRDLLAKLGSK
jgi:DNA mismatch repair ATPase MutL